jgi:hypothetical protein
MTTYTKEEIANGLFRAQVIYEGWKLEELDPEQLLEAIEQANSYTRDRGAIQKFLEYVADNPKSALARLLDTTEAKQNLVNALGLNINVVMEQPNICTRPAPHLCRIDGPCNGYPRDST